MWLVPPCPGQIGPLARYPAAGRTPPWRNERPRISRLASEPTNDCGCTHRLPGCLRLLGRNRSNTCFRPRLVTMFSNYVFTRISHHVRSLTGASYCYRLPTEQAGLDPYFAIFHTQLQPDRGPRPSVGDDAVRGPCRRPKPSYWQLLPVRALPLLPPDTPNAPLQTLFTSLNPRCGLIYTGKSGLTHLCFDNWLTTRFAGKQALTGAGR
jgi:hypothetical protein